MNDKDRTTTVSGRSPKTWPPGCFLIIQLIVISGMLILCLLFTKSPPWGGIPTYAWSHVLPLWVPFGGALGGATISLVGVVIHANDWDGPGYAFWHLARPLLGLISGSIAVLILLFVLKGIATDIIPDASREYSDGGIAVLFTLAFVVGYREETFRELVKRVADVILGPGQEAATQPISFVPAVLSLEVRAAALQKTSRTVVLVNASQDTYALANDALSITPSENLEAEFTSTEPLGPGQMRTVNVTWNPINPVPGSTDAILRARLGGRVVTATVRCTTTA
ncbi:MAG: hypothetical protein WCG47_32340 [Dermatophilaceae bacterium]